ncbi:hypothetical protein LX64_05087 [Chitinophaga skermanii]|uniref:Uncharacterized protein n=1 Tax=Chitinophaga skermanii TaxID=331697 RepID=A0A327PZU1_9BACT|nr:hypothetical protein [Chitinophaga skermanii]RAI97579.1 hypothetical protein LX64_05087 [Chitinophaga skermanii]
MRFPIILFIATMLTGSCMQQQKEKPAIRPYVFNDSGLKVITTIINEKAGTVSMLYGNKAAMDYQINGFKAHQPNEMFQLVTFREQDNKFWFGSYINGELLHVETVKTQAAGQPTYNVQHYNGPTISAADPARRTDFILSLPPAFYPCEPHLSTDKL